MGGRFEPIPCGIGFGARGFDEYKSLGLRTTRRDWTLDLRASRPSDGAPPQAAAEGGVGRFGLGSLDPCLDVRGLLCFGLFGFGQPCSLAASLGEGPWVRARA